MFRDFCRFYFRVSVIFLVCSLHALRPLSVRAPQALSAQTGGGVLDLSITGLGKFCTCWWICWSRRYATRSRHVYQPLECTRRCATSCFSRFWYHWLAPRVQHLGRLLRRGLWLARPLGSASGAHCLCAGYMFSAVIMSMDRLFLVKLLPVVGMKGLVCWLQRTLGQSVGLADSSSAHKNIWNEILVLAVGLRHREPVGRSESWRFPRRRLHGARPSGTCMVSFRSVPPGFLVLACFGTRDRVRATQIMLDHRSKGEHVTMSSETWLHSLEIRFRTLSATERQTRSRPTSSQTKRRHS